VLAFGLNCLRWSVLFRLLKDERNNPPTMSESKKSKKTKKTFTGIAETRIDCHLDHSARDHHHSAVTVPTEAFLLHPPYQ